MRRETRRPARRHGFTVACFALGLLVLGVFWAPLQVSYSSSVLVARERGEVLSLLARPDAPKDWMPVVSVLSLPGMIDPSEAARLWTREGAEATGSAPDFSETANALFPFGHRLETPPVSVDGVVLVIGAGPETRIEVQSHLSGRGLGGWLTLRHRDRLARNQEQGLGRLASWLEAAER